MQVGLQPRELEAKALHGKAKEVCSYAKKKKEQGNLRARKVVKLPQCAPTLEQCHRKAEDTQHKQQLAGGR